jgi:glycosyltransferase involved in cell wall biosynthesis
MNPIYYLRLRRSGAATVNWSCAGYELHDFVKYRWLRKQRSKIYEHPRGWLQRQLKDFSVHNMDAMITYSEHTSRYWRDVYDITPEKIIIAHNSIDTAPFCQCRQELEKKNVCREPKKILFVGKLTEAKSVDLLLMAYEQIQDRHPGSSLRIIGDGPEKERLRRLSSELMLRNVEFIDGIYNQHELAKQMYPASVFVLPGLGGLGINSAMAMGLPIICSRGDGTEKHLVEHGRNGFIFDSSLTGLVKTLDNALSTPNMLVRMGEKSAELIETRFNLNTMVQAFLFCIERVTKK